MPAENKPGRLSNSEFKTIEPKTIELLKKDGYVILNLQGWDLNYLKGTGLRFELEFDPQSYYFKLERSINGQIAINPEKLWIPQSEHQSLDEQEVRALELNKDLSQKYPGVKVEMGRVTDWLSIAHLFQITNEGRPLFKEIDRRIRTLSGPNIDKAANIGV